MYPFLSLSAGKVITVYKGVTKTTEGYIATLGKTRIGVFNSAVEAALAYDITVVATFGDFATERNFPELTEAELDRGEVFC